MSTDFSQKERAFIDGLRAETGRDLAGWLQAIAASGSTHRNDIIDWLRQQGFTFAKASWLERIHHNGGALIYANAREPGTAATRKPRPAAQRTEPTASAAPAPARPAPVHPTPVHSASAKPAARDDQAIDALLLAAKAYRPLAQVLLRDVLAAVPGADARAVGGYIVFSHSAPFAALAPTPKDVRLLLALGTAQAGAGWQKAKLGPGLDELSALTHMLVLTDARQVTRELKDLVATRARETA
jgi:hypothetical protein